MPPFNAHPNVVTALAVVGFVSLIGGALWLALYAKRYVPDVVNGAGSAAVYLGSFFSPAPATLEVVPTPVSSNVPSTPATSTAPAASTTPVVSPPVIKPAPVVPVVPGPPATNTYPIVPAPAPIVASGLPDLTVIIKSTGYLATSSADSFVASSTVPVGSRPAVSFTIKNIGSNTATPWRFSASIPTQSSYIFQSQVQQVLAPGDSIDYILGFDQANKGTGQMISITANFDRALTETSTNNNSATSYLTILGS
ncbi:MAG: hypothetical protein AAB442_02885 [Patescibacteria group bacterium]